MTSFRHLEEKDIPQEYKRCIDCYGDGVEVDPIQGLIKCHKCDGTGVVKNNTDQDTKCIS